MLLFELLCKLKCEFLEIVLCIGDLGTIYMNKYGPMSLFVDTGTRTIIKIVFSCPAIILFQMSFYVTLKIRFLGKPDMLYIVVFSRGGL